LQNSEKYKYNILFYQIGLTVGIDFPQQQEFVDTCGIINKSSIYEQINVTNVKDFLQAVGRARFYNWLPVCAILRNIKLEDKDKRIQDIFSTPTPDQNLHPGYKYVYKYLKVPGGGGG
jgi:hypothetical protein